jgi:hypothetical protein
MRGHEMTPKQLALIASFVVSGLFLIEPARAVTPVAQSLVISGESAMAAQPINQRRCYGYRDGRRVYRPCPPQQYWEKRKSSWYGLHKSGYYKPWSGIQLCENCPAIK